LVVYATASLTGGWLGTPPWRRPERIEPLADDGLAETHFGSFNVGSAGPRRDVEPNTPDRSRGTALLLAAGVACVSFGLWPRRRPEAT
jgi:hypothetical protein